MENIVIGIEGLVGCGKTSICRELLNIIPNSIVIHGGNLYRGIVYALMQTDNKLYNSENTLKTALKNVDIKKMMDILKVDIKVENRETVIFVNGKKVDEEKLQSKESSMAVSIVGGNANNANLFIFARNLINKFKEKYNIILSGRALNEIYPELNYHFLITASIEERVKRKSHQYKDEINTEELRKHIEKRDELQEKAGFYKIHKNTVVVDVTECKNARESTEKLCENIEAIKTILYN